jgi:hypothetical protein
MFRFTIRDVLWLTVVVGILAAWWMDHRQYAFWDRHGTTLAMELRAAGWRVTYGTEGPTLIPRRDTTRQEAPPTEN